MPEKTTHEASRQEKHIAYLSSTADYISFDCKGRTIRFKGPYSLVRIDHVVEWDHGYIVVMAAYTYTDGLVEDYIDLTPILENLYIEPEVFLEGIDQVEVKYA